MTVCSLKSMHKDKRCRLIESLESDHPLLAQVPLTVSPFVSLPTATSLPYTYKTLPTSLPASSTGDDPTNDRPKFIISSSGQASHPDDIIATCNALQEHLMRVQSDAEETLRQWQAGIAERELAEKRRVAPGWLDRLEKILEPEKRESLHVESIIDAPEQDQGLQGTGAVLSPQESAGAELDRAFGTL